MGLNEPEICFTHIPHFVKISGLSKLTFEEFRVFGPDLEPLASGASAQDFVVIVAPKAGRINLTLGSETRTFNVKHGVRCHPHPADASFVSIEVLKDLNCVLNFREKNIFFELQLRGEKANLPLPPGGVFFEAAIPGIPRLFRAPLPVEDLRAARVYTPQGEPPLPITAECSEITSVGEAGKLTISVKQNLPAGIPLKGAWRLILPADGLLLSGATSGMKTFLPGETQILLDFFPIVPGELFLPGVEIELLPNGDFFRLEKGPKTFAMPRVWK